MKESYEKDLASHLGPEPYAVIGNDGGVAWAKGTHRPAIELRKSVLVSRADLLQSKGRQYANCVNGRAVWWRGVEPFVGDGKRSRRTCACVKTPDARTGRPHRFPRQPTARNGPIARLSRRTSVPGFVRFPTIIRSRIDALRTPVWQTDAGSRLELSGDSRPPARILLSARLSRGTCQSAVTSERGT